MKKNAFALIITAFVCALPSFTRAMEKPLTVRVDGLPAWHALPSNAAACRIDESGSVAAGPNQSIALRWTQGPEATRSYAVVMSDLDVPNDHALADKPDVHIAQNAPRHEITHWLLANIPANVTSLPQAASRYGLAGRNTRGKLGYSGPCPPWNDAKPHRYVIEVYAVDEPTLFSNAFTREDFDKAVHRHALASGSVMQLYAIRRR